MKKKKDLANLNPNQKIQRIKKKKDQIKVLIIHPQISTK
jgi:hypothetical protein